MADDAPPTGLKMLVIGLGVLLLLGTAALGALMYYKSRTPEAAQTNTALASPPARDSCDSANLDLRAYGHVTEVTAEGRRVRFVLGTSDGTVTVITAEPCGRILHRLTVKAQPR